MSQENLEFVLDSYARYNTGERRPELWYWHEDAEYHASSEDPDSDVHRGIAAIRKQFERWEEAYPDLRWSRWRPKRMVSKSCCGCGSSAMEQVADSPSKWSWRMS
jgi:hypothetical protein